MKGSFRKRGCKCEGRCKCGATWSFSIDIGRDHLTNKRKQKTMSGFKTKKEAELACAQMITDIESGTYSKPDKMLVNTFLNNWLETKESSLKKATHTKYTGHVNNHIVPYFENVLLNKLAPIDVSKLYNHLAKDKGLSDRTIKDIHTIFKNALEHAYKWGNTTRNIAPMITKPKVVKKEIKVWTLDQSRIFLNVAKKSSRTYIAFLLALTTGMRQGEILGLRWKDIDFKNQNISVIQTLEHDGKSFNSQAKTSAGNRSISIDDDTIQELETHRKKVINSDKMRLGVQGYKDLDLVIPTSTGFQLFPRNLLRSFYAIMVGANKELKAAEQPELPKIRFHDLRHTHASLLLQQGVHPKIVAERLGHSDSSFVLDIYSHILPNIQKDTAASFGKVFFEQPEKSEGKTKIQD